MKKPIKIIIIGPFPNPISGVSIANKNVYMLLKENEQFITGKINTTYPKFDENLGKFSFKKMFFYLKLNFKILKILKADKIYLTPGQTFFGILKYAPFILLSSFLKKELIIHVHGNFIKDQYLVLKGWKKKIYSQLISKFQKGIVLSKSLKNNLSPFLEDSNIFSLPNFAEDYLLENQKINDKSKELRIIYLSNLMKEKGIIELLKTLKILEDKKIAYKAKIAGNIDVKSKEDILSLLNNLENTEFLGVVHGEEKKNLLLWGDVFVLPTYYRMEGQPISIIEAMATNNLIISTKHAGIPDIMVDNVNGYFVKKKNIIDLKEKIVYLINNPERLREIKETNKKKFLKDFKLQNFEEKLLRIILK